MRRLTTFIAVIFAAAAFAPLRAQSLDAFKERLAAPVVSDAAFGTARVTVTEYGDAEKAVDDASRGGSRKEGRASKRRCAYRLSRSIISSERVDSKAKASANRTSIIQFPITLSSVLS